MKNIAALLAVLLVVAGLFILKQRSSNTAEPAATSPGTVPVTRRPHMPERQGESGEQSTFLDHSLVADLRAALATKDPALIEKAFEALVVFIQEHPEMTEDYLHALRTEPEEHLLRTLSKAMQRSEALMANEDFLKSIVEIAQQQGFEQRQHIMLDTLSQAALIQPDLFGSIKKISEAADQPTQVRASAVAVYADWMQRFPEKASMLVDELGRSLKETNDEHVRALSVQLLNLHRDKLTPEIQQSLLERLKVEPEPAGRNLIASALSAADPAMRAAAFSYLQNQFTSQTDPAQRRLILAQLMMLDRLEVRPLLEQVARGNTELATDAQDYLVLANDPRTTPELIMNSLVILDPNAPAHEHGAGCKH